MKTFQSLNRAYNTVFQAGRLSLGLVVPIENYAHGAVPTMADHLKRIRLAEQLGYRAAWVRDVPFNVPSFGDAGQTFDPFTYLGYLAGQTENIALGVSSIALPLHHPVHVAKSAATIDQLSGGRMLLGIASGDRPQEYPAMNLDFTARAEHFREAFTYLRAAQESFPQLADNHFGTLDGTVDILPKPTAGKLPLLMTGYSRQTLAWNAEHADGWMNYPRSVQEQGYTVAEWRRLVAQFGEHDKPFMQPLYVILEQDDDFKPRPIQLGMRTGTKYLLEYLNDLERVGVNHVAINLRFSPNTEWSMEQLAEKVLPQFHFNNQPLPTP
ncbi:MAG: LLM class oxidoreductase [Bacteroidota bacterium]